MPVHVREQMGQTGETHYLRPTATHEYMVTGAGSRLIAQLALAAHPVPTQQEGLDVAGNQLTIYLHHISLREVGGSVMHGRAWKATAYYDSTPDVTDLQITYGSRSEKIYHALEHIRTYDLFLGGESTGQVGQCPVYNGVIGVNGDEVEGVDVEASSVEFTLTKKYRVASLPADYIQGIFRMMSIRTPVNDSDWSFIWKDLTFEFPEGSLRLRNVPIKWTSNDEIEIAYQFHYSRPIVEDDHFEIPGSNGPEIIKEGHEYGWIAYREIEENKQKKRVPYGFHIERVYPKENFNFLEL